MHARIFLIRHGATVLTGSGDTTARLWDAAAKVDRKELPTAGEILAALSGGKISGETYDREQPERLKSTLY